MNRQTALCSCLVVLTLALVMAAAQPVAACHYECQNVASSGICLRCIHTGYYTGVFCVNRGTCDCWERICARVTAPTLDELATEQTSCDEVQEIQSSPLQTQG
jgi:hypothetical protein